MTLSSINPSAVSASYPSPGVPCGTSLVRDNRGLYSSKFPAWNRWQDEETKVAVQRSWMDDVKPQTVDERDAQHTTSAQYKDFIKQQRQFAATRSPSSAPSSSSSSSPSSLTLTNPSTTYSAYGSHHRFSPATLASTASAPAPSSNANWTDFGTTSKRLGLDSTVRLTTALSEHRHQYALRPQHEEKVQLMEPVASSAYALGYGERHQHHRTYLNEVDKAKAARAHTAEAAVSGSQVRAAGHGRIAHGLGYAEKHPLYYRYLGRKERRER